MVKNDNKTNVTRLLTQMNAEFSVYEYDSSGGAVDGKTVAQMTGRPEYMVFKTLVTVGASKAHYVFVIPVTGELDLKKAAKAVGEKSIAMIKQAELLPLTGYVHGGCSPIGMKKKFLTVFDETAILCDTILVSAGKIGLQIEISPQTLAEITDGIFADVASE